jgi:uncharacterized membrane protein YraQ (UPF0718 family)
MNSKPVLRCLEIWGQSLRLWIVFAAQDALRAAFGWATVVNVAAFTYLSSKLGLSITAGQGWPQTLCYAIACFLISVVIAFIVNLVLVAPLEVFHDLQPLTLKVSDAVESPTLLQSLCHIMEFDLHHGRLDGRA